MPDNGNAEEPLESPVNITVTGKADIVNVEARQSGSSFSFSVSIKSPDTGCDQYADWWEIIDEDGNLLYRRILAHSHVSEQPFTRSGGTLNITPTQNIWVRAHMNNTGYGGISFSGSVNNGFQETEFPANFAIGLEDKAPLPDGCAF